MDRMGLPLGDKSKQVETQPDSWYIDTVGCSSTVGYSLIVLFIS